MMTTKISHNLVQSMIMLSHALSSECFQLMQTEKPIGNVPQGILINNATKVELMCAKLITVRRKFGIHQE